METLDEEEEEKRKEFESNDDKSSVESENSSQTAMAFDSNDRQIYEKRGIRVREQPGIRERRTLEGLIRVTTNAFAYHRMDSAARLVSALTLDKRTPHSFVAKALLILFNLKNSDQTLANDLMKTLHIYDINKRELMLEIIQILLRNKDRIGAKSFIDSNESILHGKLFRKNEIIDTYLKGYICFVDYLEWKETIDHSNEDMGYQLMIEKTKLSLKNIITENKDIILDNFVLILVEMYEYCHQLDEALDALKSYVDNNPNHLNAYIYLYNFAVKHSDKCESELKMKTLAQIVIMSPENPLVLDMVRNDWVVNEDKFKILMEFIDHKHNRNDINAWNLINEFLDSIKEDSDVLKIKDMWQKFYKDYWLKLHCDLKRIKELDQNVIEMIECKQKVVQFFYSSSHSFIIQTNEMISKYRDILVFN